MYKRVNINEPSQEELFDIVMDTIRTYGFEALDYIVTQWPEFDINYTVKDKIIGMYNFEHENDISCVAEDEEGKRYTKTKPGRFYKWLILNDKSQVLFSGRLIHYAILKDDIEAVQYLLSNGAELWDENDDNDYVNYYVNSEQMIKYIQEYIDNNGKRRS